MSATGSAPFKAALKLAQMIARDWLAFVMFSFVFMSLSGWASCRLGVSVDGDYTPAYTKTQEAKRQRMYFF